MYDSRRSIHKQVLGYIKDTKLPSYETHIRVCTKLSEAPAHHKTIYEYAPTSKGAEDYLSLIKEIQGE